MPAFLIPFMTVIFAAARLFVIANMVGFVLRLFVAFGVNFLIMEPISDGLLSLISNQIGGMAGEIADWVFKYRSIFYFSCQRSSDCLDN